MHQRRKPNVKSRAREQRVSLEDVHRAVLCDAKTETDIAGWTGASPREIERALGQLITRGLVRKTETGYEPVLSVRRAG